MTWSYLSSGLQYRSSVRYAVHRTATGAPPQHHHWGREDEAVVRARRGGFRLGGAAGNTGTVLGSVWGGRPRRGGCWGTGSGPWTGLRRSIETVLVLERVMFKREHKTSQMEDVNCALRSEVIFAGTPNLEIQPEMRALAQSTTEMEARELEKTSILSR